MKRKKRLLITTAFAVLLAAVGVCAAACGSCAKTPVGTDADNGANAPTATPTAVPTPEPTPEPTPVPDRILILGRWRTSPDILPAVEAYIKELGANTEPSGIPEKIKLDVEFVFREDGTLAYEADRAGADAAMEKLAPRLAPIFRQLAIEKLGPILSRLGDSAMLKLIGVSSWEELAKKSLTDAVAPMLAGGGRYALYDGKLILSLDMGETQGGRLSLDYALTETEMRLMSAPGANDTLELPKELFPLDLVKMKD